jgi:hypothetical protein
MALRKADSVQVVTVPAAQAGAGMNRHKTANVDAKTAGGVKLQIRPLQ